jgi:4a-hydroxytetrahydrobiopterin dehydratase
MIRRVSDNISGKDFLAAGGVEGWRIISDGACAFYPTASFQVSARLVDAIGGIDGIDQHSPSLDLRHDGVTVRLLTKRAEGYRLTTTDLELARAVERVATEQGLTADPSAIQCLLVIPGAPDRSAIMPFWRAILGYEPRIDSPDEDLVDPHDRDAAFWFEQMDEPRADGKGAIHVVVSVPYEQGAGPDRCRSGGRRPDRLRRERPGMVDARGFGGQPGRHRGGLTPSFV